MPPKASKKRIKNTVASAEKENDRAAARKACQGPMYTILSQAQLNETFHKRYVKEMKQLYEKQEHDVFVGTFKNILKTVLAAEECNDCGNTALLFCAKFVTSFESEKTHQMLAATFNWLLTTISNNPHIRYRICFFVNLILKQLGPCAALDSTQCDHIFSYMMDRLSDISASVRKQAVLAMQRLQRPDNPDDPVLCAYRFHLTSDPSYSVRQCVVSCMGRNYHTVPYILERLADSEEKVRRHTYVNMCNYPVRSYKVSQRLTLLEQGLNDSSENVRKTVKKYMLKQWVESYQRNFIALIAALKLYSTEEELERFQKIARQMLDVIFEQNANDELLAQLNLSEDCELHRCVPHEFLTVELVLYWQSLNAYFQRTQAEECELVLPELSVFCAYVQKFCQLQTPDMDKFAQMEFQCILLSLVEILRSYDLGDEIGRNNLKQLITLMLRDCQLDHKIVRELVRCMELLITDTNQRTQYFIEIIYYICELNSKQFDLIHNRSLNNKLQDDLDASMKMKASTLKVKILDLEELEENFALNKEYAKLDEVSKTKLVLEIEYEKLVRPLLEKHSEWEVPERPKLSKQERVVKSLYITYYMLASENVKSLNPNISKLYRDLICRHMASLEADIFEWAIKCGTTFSLFYETCAKEVFDIIVEQFYRNNDQRLWETSACCIFELMDHYGVDYFIDMNQTDVSVKSKRRQLYTVQDFCDGEEDISQTNEQNTDLIGMMGHFIEQVETKGIRLAIVKGLCRLVLRGQLNDRTDVLEKLLKTYFNPNTEPIVSQVLGLFFQNIVALKLQSLLQPCILPTMWTIMNCSYDSPLHDVLPENVSKFMIDLTVQESSTPQKNIHNEIALSFLHYIHNYYTERREMCRLLSKELTTLRLNVVGNEQIKTTMRELSDKLIKCELDSRMIRNIVNFKAMLEGKFNPPIRKTNDGNESDEDFDTITVTTTSEHTEAHPISETVQQPSVVTILEEVEESQETITNSEQLTTVQTTVETTADNTIVNKSVEEEPNTMHKTRRKSNRSTENASPIESISSEERTRATEITKQNLEKPSTRKKLEQAQARFSKTPERQTTNQSNDESQKEISSDEHSDSSSEVILASPTSATPPVNVSRFVNVSRLRSQRNASLRAAAVSKRNISRQNPVTPMRISPQRKKSRKSCSPKQGQTPKRQINRTMPSNGKTTGSPTDSTSSVKENEAPTRANKTSQLARESSVVDSGGGGGVGAVISINNGDSANAPTTRSTARSLRINSMCMTRKRMSLEMNLSGGQLKVPSPKRMRQQTMRKSAAKTVRTSSNSSIETSTKAKTTTSSSTTSTSSTMTSTTTTTTKTPTATSRNTPIRSTRSKRK